MQFTCKYFNIPQNLFKRTIISLTHFNLLQDIINLNDQKNNWRYSMDNHTYFNSYIFHSTYMPKYPMISKTENKSKSGGRERDNWHRILIWKTFKEIKNHGPITDRKHPLWRIKIKYKVLPSSSLPILLGPLD